MKQPTSSINGFKMEDMIYPCLYGCADGAHACSYLKPPTHAWWSGDRVFVLEPDRFIWSGIIVSKKIKLITCGTV
jgi:hypothetical protein